MPNRIIREGINSSARINALSMGAELFYRRLMTVVDDYGRYHGSVVTLRGACWPTNPDRISEKELGKWLNELLRGDDPLVKTYNVSGAVYVELQGFCQRTRSESRFPSPPWLSNDRAMPADCAQDADNPPRKNRPRRISYCGDVVRSASTPPAAATPPPRAVVVEMPKEDFERRFSRVYDNHPKVGFQREGLILYLEIISSSVNQESVAAAIDRDHAAWCQFWADNQAEYRPGIGQYFSDGYYKRKPHKARDSPAGKPRQSTAEAMLDRAAELLREEERRGEIR